MASISSLTKFQKHYIETCDKIINSGNGYYINPTDKKNLVPHANPLERNMLRYLLLFDPEIIELKKKKSAQIFMRSFFIGFGLM